MPFRRGQDSGPTRCNELPGLFRMAPFKEAGGKSHCIIPELVSFLFDGGRVAMDTIGIASE
jgi:hypothetical protein